MIIKLTNNAPGFENQPILLNSDYIVSALLNSITRPDGNVIVSTTIHCPPHGVWEVKESVEEIFSLTDNKSCGCSGKCASKRANMTILNENTNSASTPAPLYFPANNTATDNIRRSKPVEPANAKKDNKKKRK